MQKPKQVATNTDRGTGGEIVKVPVSYPSRVAVASRATLAFIPPPTRDQLMAGSANLRRVYKFET
jgi:hypothetical protein